MSNPPTPAPMVAFPERLPFDTYDDEIDYERALRLAWEQRARLAVETLQEIRQSWWTDASGNMNLITELGHPQDHAAGAIALIGELPPSLAAQE